MLSVTWWKERLGKYRGALSARSAELRASCASTRSVRIALSELPQRTRSEIDRQCAISQLTRQTMRCTLHSGAHVAGAAFTTRRQPANPDAIPSPNQDPIRPSRLANQDPNRHPRRDSRIRSHRSHIHIHNHTPPRWPNPLPPHRQRRDPVSNPSHPIRRATPGASQHASPIRHANPHANRHHANQRRANPSHRRAKPPFASGFPRMRPRR
jgi:hypothetical protein